MGLIARYLSCSPYVISTTRSGKLPIADATGAAHARPHRGAEVSAMRWATGILVASLGLAQHVFAADELMTSAQGCSSRFPASPPALAGQPQPRPRRWSSARCSTSIRGSRPVTPSAATPATTSAWVASMPKRPRSAIAGSAVGATRRPSSMRSSTRRSSGTGARRISSSRPVGRWSIRSRWPRRKEHVSEQLAAIPGYVATFRDGISRASRIRSPSRTRRRRSPSSRPR